MIDDLLNYKTGIRLDAGKLLISEPTLLDQNFQRTVIFLCHHDGKESAGYILNRMAPQGLSYYVDLMDGYDFPIYIGGPVELTAIHFIHTFPELNGTPIGNQIYWSGDIRQAFEYIKMGKMTEQNARFFIGYSGWGEGQLEAEMDMNSWLVADANEELIFNTKDDELWKASIESLGPKYKNLLFVPKDPNLN